LLLAWTLATGVWWILIPARALWNGRRLGALSALPGEKPERWPSVSILVPARNEEQTLAESVLRLCEVDYPELEIILVDDLWVANWNFACKKQTNGESCAL
jgi:cellulose synthase/poly-beta-1,6-N-acetylglucosamine synthase-like glycosyltransferase